MLWADIQQPMYQLHYDTTSMPSSNTTLLPSNEFKFAPQTAHIYEMQSYYNTNQQQEQTLTATTSAGSISSSGTEDEDLAVISRRSSSSTQNRKRKMNSTGDANDEKRKIFLERNRQAALKCRQRKKQWLTNLQERVKLLANDNEQLQVQANVMRDEVLNLRSLLLAHKNCPMPTNLPPQYHNFYSTNKDVC